MQITAKVNGDTLSATEFNQITTELQTGLITSAGETPASGTLDQVGIAVASYAAQCGVFATDSGVADAYVLTQVSPFKPPFDLKDGLTIRFRAGNTNTGACTVNAFAFGLKNIKKADGSTNPSAGDISTTQDTLLRYDGTVFRIISNFVISQLPSGSTIQIVNTQTGASSSGTTLIPSDDTIPQNTEGDQYMSLDITPTNAANILYIDIVAIFSNSVIGTVVTTALFQDSTANALAAAQDTCAQDYTFTVNFRHKMTAGTTSAATFKVRMGGDQVSTTTFNGKNGSRRLGGVLASSITITEVKA